MSLKLGMKLLKDKKLWIGERRGSAVFSLQGRVGRPGVPKAKELRTGASKIALGGGAVEAIGRRLARHLVVEVLNQYGVATNWSGAGEERIRIPSFLWFRRGA